MMTLALVALLLAAQPAASEPTVDVFFEGPPSEDHADILYLVYVSKPGIIRVYLPLNSEVRGVYWFTADDLSWTPDRLTLPPRSDWDRHRVKDWRLTSERVEWRDRLYAPIGDDWVVRVPVDGIPETVRSAFAGLLERGHADVPVLEARVDPGLLVVEVRARLVNCHLLMYLVPGYRFNVGTYTSGNRHSYHLEPTNRGFVIEQGAPAFPLTGPTLASFGLEDLKKYEYFPVEVDYWGWGRGGPPRHRHLVLLPPIPPPVRRRRLAVLLLLTLALLPTAAHANPRILPPHPPSPVFISQITVVKGKTEGKFHEVHVFVRLWPGTEGTVYVPCAARVRLAAIVPADAVLSSATADEVKAWCERHHPPSPENGRTTFQIPEEVSLITWWEEEFRTRRELLLESNAGRVMRPILDGALALRVRADDDSFLYLDLLVPAEWRYLPLGITPSLLLRPIDDPILALARVGDRWYVSLANSKLLRSLHPDLLLLALNIGWARRPKLNTEQLWGEDLRRLSEGPETVIVRLVRGGEALVDVVATVPEVPLPAGARILRCGTVPRDAYRGAYTGVLAPGFQPVRYRVVREGEASVPEVGTLRYQVVRVDLPRGRLLLIRAIVPLVNGELVMPVVKGGTMLGSQYERKEAAGFEWLVAENPESLKGFRKFVPPSRKPRPLSLKEALVALLIVPLLLPAAIIGVTLESVAAKLPYPISEPIDILLNLLSGCVELACLLGALLLGKLPL